MSYIILFRTWLLNGLLNRPCSLNFNVIGFVIGAYSNSHIFGISVRTVPDYSLKEMHPGVGYQPFPKLVDNCTADREG